MTQSGGEGGVKNTFSQKLFIIFKKVGGGTPSSPPSAGPAWSIPWSSRLVYSLEARLTREA